MSATREATGEGGRYSGLSVVLHWILAALLLAQVFVGGRFSELPRGPEKTEWYVLHFSLGITILLLSLVRLGWRIANPAPPLPDQMTRPVKVFARATHVGFYVVMLGMPLTGWAMASMRRRPIPELWGTVLWPRLPLASGGDTELLETLHADVILKLFWVLLFLHVAGALRHHFLLRDQVLWRMLPVVPRPRV